MFEDHYRELLHFIQARVGDRDAAADLVQESYARVYASAAQSAVAHPRALLFITAKNLLVDRHRRAQARGLPPRMGGDASASGHDSAATEPDPLAQVPDAPARQPDAIVDARQRLALLERTLASLPERPRQAFALSKLDGLSRSEVAQAMGIGVRTVETHLEVAMQACQQALAEHRPTLGAAPSTTAGRPTQPNRLRRLAGAALVLGLGGWLSPWPGLQAQAQVHARTRRGEQRTVDLPDGSQAVLDTASALRAQWHAEHRVVQLLGGRLYLDARPDPARPLSLQAAGLRLQLQGARLSLRWTPEVPEQQDLLLVVEQGWVLGPGPDGLLVRAGQAAVFGADGALHHVREAASGEAQAWRQPGLVSVNDASLAQVLAELERHAPQGVAAVHPAVARLRVSGSFDPQQAQLTLGLWARTLPLRVLPGPGGWRLLPLPPATPP